MQAVQRDGRPQRPPLRAPGWLDKDGRLAQLAHASLVLALGAFIVAGPAAGQIFGRHCAFLREWIMFSGSGVGVLKGRFVLHQAQGAERLMTPLEVLGMRTYPDTSPEEFSRLVLNVSGLKTAAATVCDKQADGSRLSFKGWVGTRRGWRSLAVEDVCALPAPVTGDGSQDEDPLL